MKIYAPNPDYSGDYFWGDGTHTVFEGGVAELEDEPGVAVLAYLKANGYGIDKPAPKDDAELPAPPDPRDAEVNQVGTRLRDAAVNPQPGDFLAPINAGKPGPEGNPHGPNVVSPEIHGSVGQAIAPGPVSTDPEVQEAKEAELAQRTRIDSEPVPEVTADLGKSGEVGEPKGNASREEWAAYAKSRGASDEQLEDKSRDDIRAEYGS